MPKRMKLASKLALVIGMVLNVMLVVLICITVTLSKSAISTSTYGELDAISTSNAAQIQEIFNSAETVASDIQHYLERAYKAAEDDMARKTIPQPSLAAVLGQSQIYDQMLTPLNYDTEVYIRELAINSAQYNEDLAGVGIMFEPYKFQGNMKNYAFYVDESALDGTISPMGKYDEYSEETYYKEAAASKKPVVTEPYVHNGVTMVSFATPIIYKDELYAVAMADINVNNFNKVRASSQHYPSMYATIYDDTGRVIYDSQDTANVGRMLSDFTRDSAELSQMQGEMALGEAFQIETTREDGRKVTRFFTPIDAAGETWWSLTAVDTKEINSAVSQTVFWMLIISAAALIIIIGTVIVLLRKMLSPVGAMVEAAGSIAGGRLDVQLPSKTNDEIGMLSGTFNEMAKNLNAIVTDVDYVLGEMAEGNFNVRTRAEESYVGAFEGIKHSMRKLNNKLSIALSQINESADQVSEDSGQVSSGAQALSQGAAEQASSIEELAAMITEMRDQAEETARNAAQARRQSVEAGKVTADCNTQMQAMIGAMDEIGGKSGQIGKIIKTIEDIAFQTNILALNAAVEAARAGEAGKGFAVVADEVRNLAGKSAQASKNTAELIQGTVDAVGKGMRIADETAGSLDKVVESTRTVAAIVDKIADAADGQSRSINQVTQGVDQISNVIQTNSATSEESAAASEELSGQAQMLKSLVGQFKLKEIKSDDNESYS